MPNDWINTVILEDDDEDDKKQTDIVEQHENINKIIKKRTRVVQMPLKKYYDENEITIEIGSDEAGRGPLFGRVYSAAVILPKDDTFDHYKMKDSKKFHSKKKIKEVAEYIKKSAIAWSVKYADEVKIDDINILQATQWAMHEAIKDVKNQILNIKPELNIDDLLLLIDGNYFNPLYHFNKTTSKPILIKHELVEGGDNKYTSIAAASILAKVERDTYIEELCLENPELSEKYGIDSNKGYGAKKHMDGIKKFGITKWHRRSFGICKEYS
jgi:ribonuclease HII